MNSLKPLLKTPENVKLNKTNREIGTENPNNIYFTNIVCNRDYASLFKKMLKPLLKKRLFEHDDEIKARAYYIDAETGEIIGIEKEF